MNEAIFALYIINGMTTIYLVRHGETEENAMHILQGHLPGHLTENGKEQLRLLREDLNGLTFDAALCSDLQRCIDSLNILLEDNQLPVLYTKELRERDWGSFTGREIESVRNEPIPSDVETVECMLLRAKSFLTFVKSAYPDKTLLVMSHGLFCRAIQAEYWEKPMKEIEPMRNASYRTLVL